MGRCEGIYKLRSYEFPNKRLVYSRQCILECHNQVASPSNKLSSCAPGCELRGWTYGCCGSATFRCHPYKQDVTSEAMGRHQGGVQGIGEQGRCQLGAEQD
jgi:hypothetical protein